MHGGRYNLHQRTVITHLFVYLLRPSLVHNILTHSFDVHSLSQPLRSPPPLLSHMPSLALTHSHLLLLTHCSQLHTSSLFLSPLSLSVTHFQSSLSLLFINPLDDMVPHLASLFILHDTHRVRLLSPSLYRLPPPIPIKDLRAPLSANQVVIRAAKIRGLINKGLSLLASGSLCLNR